MSKRTTVIVYHAVGHCAPSSDPHELFISPERFADQMEYLSRKRSVVDLDALVDGTASGNRPLVAITFDDGYRNVLTNAAPTLQRYGLPATIFVPTKWIGISNTWNEPTGCDLDIMTAEELRAIDDMGVRVESHGHAHIDYETSAPDEVREDVEQSVELLTEILGRSPRHFAYPFGSSSLESRKVVAAAGFASAFSISSPGRGTHAQERVWIRPGHGISVFALKTSGLWSASLRDSPVARTSAALVRPLLLRKRR